MSSLFLHVHISFNYMDVEDGGWREEEIVAYNIERGEVYSSKSNLITVLVC